MHAIVGDHAPRDKTEAIARVAPYIDTIEVSSRRSYPSALLKAIIKNSGSVVPNVVRDKNDPKVIWHYLLAINQPSRHCIELLQRYTANANLSIYRFHLALDVTEIRAGVPRGAVVDVFARLAHLRYRRGSDELYEEQGTRYSIQTKLRRSRVYRNTAFYTGKDSKITGEENAIHFEIRLERKRSVLAAGIEEPADVFNMKPAEFVTKHLSIRDHRGIYETVTRRLIKGTTEQHPTPHPLVDVERRVRAILRRLGMDHVSGFGRYYKKQFERLQHWDCIDVEDTLNWASADVRCE